MSEAQAPAPPKAKRDRSPSFPFIPLKVAIERLEALDKHFGRHPTPADHVGAAWGMKEQSSQTDQTLAALRSFGLIQYEGIGPKRVVTISEDGRRYLRAQQESVKEAIRKQSALRPKIIRQFWAMWGADRPVDAVALDTLILQNAFSDNGARSFLKVYDETVGYAGLGDSDKMNPATETGDEEQETGSMENEETSELARGPSVPQVLSPKPYRLGEGWIEPAHGMRREVITLDEGDVLIVFPDNLSPESFGDLQDHLELFIKKMQRRAKIAQKDEAGN
jgi:hypothetical protein